MRSGGNAHRHKERIELAGLRIGLANGIMRKAMASRRFYKEPFPHAKGVEIMAEGRGKPFAPPSSTPSSPCKTNSAPSPRATPIPSAK